jgi:thioredoxin reductase (NADPH)
MSDVERKDVEKVVIIGSGPAGWTAALYAARANLEPLVFEGAPRQEMIPGGQLMFTTDVENFPGYPDGITGQEMMADLKRQAERFGTRVITDDIVKCGFDERPFLLESESNGAVKAHAVIIATGAVAQWLGLPNETRLAQSGGGVSACAVCDGALPPFRDQHLVVVGGGDTAMEEADFLTKFASKVTIAHRRDELRASKIMQDRVLQNPKVEMAWNTIVVDVLGDEVISGVRFKDTVTGEERDQDCKGLFIAIGHKPNTGFLGGQIDHDDSGYLIPIEPPTTKTNIEGVFAAGDVADKVYRQAITAAGTGCASALDAERWLAAQGLH